MACTSCGSGFRLLNREIGCANCGFSFCAKCCSKKTYTKAEETVKKQICNRCFESLTSSESKQVTYSPPLAYKKRMAKLGNRSMSLGSGSSSFENEKDKEIAERLQKLKRERPKDVQPTELEIEERLAKLKGMDPAKFTAPPITVFRPPDRRSTMAQVTDLLMQLTEEVNLDSKRDDDLALRLAKLKDESIPQEEVPETIIPSVTKSAESIDIEEESKQLLKDYEDIEKRVMEDLGSLQNEEEYKKVLKTKRDKQQGESTDIDIDEEDDEEAEELVQKLLAVNIEGSEFESLVLSPEEEEKKLGEEDDPEEFPWCVICTENAKMRCFGCDNDLYCMNCFRECHDSLDMKDHKTCPFLSPRKL